MIQIVIQDPLRSSNSSLQIEGGTNASLWLSWYDTSVPIHQAFPSVWQTQQMVGLGLRTWLCISWVLLPSALYLFHLDLGSGKWLREVVSRSPRWRNSPECSSTWLFKLLNALLRLCKGAPSRALKHEFGAYDKKWAGVVVRVTWVALEFASPCSRPLLSVGELGCGHNSLSRYWSILRKGHSISARGPPFPKLGREG